jgi:hypothetical protein
MVRCYVIGRLRSDRLSIAKGRVPVRANDANRGPAGVRGTRLPRSPQCETHSAFEAGS